MKVNRILILLILLQFALTVVHHLYGEFALYKDGVRLHIVFIAPLALALTFAPLWIHKNKFGLQIFIVWSVVIWVMGVGIFEGLWNHLVVNTVNLLNLNETYSWAFIRLTPGDLIFEVSGMGQFLVGCVLFYFIYQFQCACWASRACDQERL